MTNDTRYLTSENVSLRPSHLVEGLFIIDLHSNPYGHNVGRAIGVAALMPSYMGGYVPYDWTTGVRALSEDNMTLSEALLVITQHLSPYTFTS